LFSLRSPLNETDAAGEPRLVAVLGSVTRPGRLHAAVSQALERAAAAGARTELIDLAATRVAFADGRPPHVLEDDTARVVAALDSASAVVLATPVYRGSLTGALKNLLDHVPVGALQRTPTGLVAMGGSDHHHLGAERHLRDVLAFFGAHVLPTAVYLTPADFDSEGRPRERAAAELDAVVGGALSLARALVAVPPLGPPPLVARPRSR
jgi:FMN reductase